MRNVPLAILLGAITSLWGPYAHGAPTLPQWVDEGLELGLPGFATGNISSVWMDADMDGRMEVVYLAFTEARVLDIAQDGSHVSHTLEVLGGPPLKGVGPLPTPVLALLDVDRDGVSELMVFGETVRLFRLTAPNQLTDMQVPLPLPPGAGLFDAATGDLNNDGLNDVIFAQGLLANEKLERVGYPDSALMNLGHGRFEMVRIEPARADFSNGISLADVDGDRRLDIVESMNYSAIVGASRILLNRTPPGAAAPVFETHVSSLTLGGQATTMVPGYDTGTHGMGTCIADVNGDGYIDIYNTSMGVDQLSLGRSDGGFDDATFTHGILHSYGTNGLRVQWSPTFIDLNLDGLLDIYVRHGGLGMSMPGTLGPGLTVVASDAVYVQGTDGTFARGDIYADPDHNMGRSATLGDLDQDGQPDVAQGGASGAAGYFRNVTSVPDTTRKLTVGFKSTVSATPAYGVRVTGTCGEQTWNRVTSSGGKIGSVEAHEVYFAWPGCQTDPQLVVQWPSGATVNVSDVSTPYHLATEPEWWTVPDMDSRTVIVHPAAGGGAEACVGGYGDAEEPAGLWVCCSSEEGTCTLDVPEMGDERALVRLDDHPPMALPWQTERWTLITEPQPPSPGDPATFYVMHVGSPGAFDDMVKPTLFLDGEYLAWSEMNGPQEMLTAEVTVKDDAHELELSLSPTTFPEPTFVVGTGYGLDPVLAQVDVYPYRIMGGVTELWTLTLFVTGIRGHEADDIVPHVKLYRPDGVEIPSSGNMNNMTTARLRLIVGLDELEGLSQVILKDGPSGVEIPIDLPPPLTMEEASDRIEYAKGGPNWNRLAEGGDHTGIFFGLYDAQDRLMSPEPSLVYVQADGAEIMEPLELAFGQFQLVTHMETLPGVTDGEVRVYTSADDRLLGTFPFSRRAPSGWGARLDMSTVEIVEINDLWGSGVTHDVIVRVANGFDEVLGANAPVEVEITQFGEFLEMHLIGNGNWVASVQANTGKGVVEADVYIEGTYFDTVSMESNIPIPPAPPKEEPPPEEDSPTGPGDAPPPEDEAPTSTSDGGGCGGAGTPPLGGLLWLLATALVVWTRPRRDRAR